MCVLASAACMLKLNTEDTGCVCKHINKLGSACGGRRSFQERFLSVFPPLPPTSPQECWVLRKELKLPGLCGSVLTCRAVLLAVF